MIARFTYPELAVSRWRNGGGETREIISFPPGAERWLARQHCDAGAGWSLLCLS